MPPIPPPCLNHKTCRGYAEPGRALCACCIAAQDEAKDAKNEKIIKQAGVKPRKLKDVWGK